MKDWFITGKFKPKFSVTLTRPIYIVDDNYKLKREIIRALIEEMAACQKVELLRFLVHLLLESLT